MNRVRREKVALLGGTGKEGQGLAARLAAAGFDVTVGSREAGKAAAAAAELAERIPDARVRGCANTEAVQSADFVFLCVPFDGAAALLKECRALWKEGAIAIDTTVPLRFDAGGASVLDLPESCGSEHLLPHLPLGVALVAAFKTISAHTLAEIGKPLDCDVIVCGNDASAKARVIEMASCFAGLRALDGGPLRNARAIEAMCALAIGLNRRYKAKSARFRVVGV